MDLSVFSCGISIWQQYTDIFQMLISTNLICTEWEDMK